MRAVFQRAIGQIDAVEKDGLITVRGVPSRTIASDIRRIWATSRINSHMLTRLNRFDFSFASFFAPDVLYTLRELARHPTSQTNVRAINRIIAALVESTWLAKTVVEPTPFLDYSRLKQLNVKLLDHQQRFLEQYEQQTIRYGLDGYLLAGAPGSGKTLGSLALSLALNADAVVVVSPKNAIHKVWEKTLLTNYKQTPTYWVSGGDAGPGKDVTHFITHYEALGKLLDWLKGRRFKRPMVILDESHNLNEIKSLRTQQFIELCTQLGSKHILWASGTPVKALGGEMVPFLKTIDPLFTDDAQQRFLKIFGRNSTRANDILRHRLGLVTFKVEKSEYSERNVDEIEHKVSIPNGSEYTLEQVRRTMSIFINARMDYYAANKASYEESFARGLAAHEKTLRSAGQQADYRAYQYSLAQLRRPGRNLRELREQIVHCNQYELKVLIPSLPANLKDDFKQARSVVKYVELKVMGECLGQVLGRQRVECHLDMIEHVGLPTIIDRSRKKTLIFTSYVAVADATAAYLREQGFQPLVVHGTTGESLTQTVTRFEKEIDANPLIATFKSLSTAVPLTVANTCVMLNVPFRSYEYEQALSRVDRIGQDTKVEIYNVLLDTGLEPNLSTRSNDIMEWSKEQVESMMGTGEVDMALESIVPEEILFELPYESSDAVFVDPLPQVNYPRSAQW